LAAVSAGGDGYLAWDAGEDALVATLRAVLDGELGISGRAARSVVRELRRAAKLHTTRAEVSAALTTREQEVFDLVRQGTRSHDIAELLCIADATVYKHIQNILDKLHVRSRAQAIMLAELDIPDPPPNGRH
jgi:DNA-binding NarL/FixJ family response regulator